MGLEFEIFDARDIMSWPDGESGNDTDTVFGNVHFNLTTLKHFNYTYFSNGTLSNGTKCYLTFEPYQPALLYTNGTFVNATKCYTAIDDIGTRGFVGIGFAVLYGIALVLTLTSLTKHGKSYLPREKRFYPVGRRWQWYWGLFVCACALISLFVNVDVDRYYLPELPITVTVFFWFLICQGTMALVWEAVRHWGSWQERQYIDPNPFELREDDRRAKTEFWLPLWFYLWVWLNFFMVVPRSWTFTQLQRSPEQTAAKAIPGATSIRFKIGGFMLVVAWLTIVFSLRHSIKHYKPRNRGLFNRGVGFLRAMPFRFMLMIPLLGALIAYQILMSFVWELSLIRYDGIVPVQYVWGYGPPLLILYIQAAYGIATPNEDKQLIQQRRIRGDAVDAELGLTRKPAWWRRVKGDHLTSMRDKIARNVHEVGGGRATGRRVEQAAERQAREEAEANARDDDIEMQPYHHRRPSRPEDNPRADRAGVHSQQHHAKQYGGKSDRRRQERTVEVAAGILFPNSNLADRARREAELHEDGPAPPPYRDEVDRGRPRSNRSGSNGRSNSAETTNSITAQPQQVRSMLDI